MRIISQNGTIDCSYDNGNLYVGCVRHEDGTEDVRIYYSSSSLRGTILAEYTSEAKTIKAMEMLREKYLSRMELNGGYDAVNGCYVQPNFWVLPKVFQFPKDEEVEVEDET